MYHFLHKHRHWLLALIVISVIAIVYFQLRDDGGMPVGPVNPPNQQQPVSP